MLDKAGVHKLKSVSKKAKGYRNDREHGTRIVEKVVVQDKDFGVNL
jgi:hypothetical protein